MVHSGDIMYSKTITKGGELTFVTNTKITVSNYRADLRLYQCRNGEENFQQTFSKRNYWPNELTYDLL